MQIVVVGTGYVGLVVAACLADLGYRVTAVDRDPSKVAMLRQGIVPISEPGLQELVGRTLASGRLSFSGQADEAARTADFAYLAVGTPPHDDGLPDTASVLGAVQELAGILAARAILVVKSTVPVGTAARLRALLDGEGREDIAVVSNPEFLAEGSALSDFSQPDRVVLGCSDPLACERVERLYSPMLKSGVLIQRMDNASAEMSKYAANAMLAARVSLMNELANMCSAVGADIERVREVVGADERIGAQYLYAGCGYGGSCFPKDLLALEAMGRRIGVETRVVRSVRETNAAQKLVIATMLKDLLGTVRGRTVGLWGLAFKPNTDDIRQAPSLVVIDQLLEDGADVVAYDPAAMDHVRARYGDRIRYAASAGEASEGVDALAILTEWSEFRGVDLSRLAQHMSGRIVVDGRNLFDPREVAAAGLIYASIGRPTARPNVAASTQEGA